MIEVTVLPEPQPAPPEYVRIEGIPRADAEKLAVLLGRLESGSIPDLYNSLIDALRGEFPSYATRPVLKWQVQEREQYGWVGQTGTLRIVKRKVKP